MDGPDGPVSDGNTYDVSVLEAVSFSNGGRDSVAYVLGVVRTDGSSAAGISVQVAQGEESMVTATDASGEVDIVFPRRNAGGAALSVTIEGIETHQIPSNLDSGIEEFDADLALRSVNLSWTPLRNSRVIGYQIQRGELVDNVWSATTIAQVDEPAADSYADLQAVPGIVYQYRVNAVLASGRIIPGRPATVRAGLHAALDVAGDVRDIVYDAARHRLYISVGNDHYGGSDRYPGELFVLDAETMGVVSRIAVEGGGRGPAGLALSRNGQNLYVAVPGYRDIEGTSRVVTVDLDALTSTSLDFTPHLRTPWWIVEESPGRIVVIANPSTSVNGQLGIVSIEASSGAVTRVETPGSGSSTGEPIAYAKYANGLAVSPDGRRTYVTGRNSSGVVWHADLSSETAGLESWTQTGSFLGQIAASNSLLFANGTAYDGETLSFVKETVEGVPATSPDNARVYIFSGYQRPTGDPTTVYDAVTGRELGKIPSGIAQTTRAVIGDAGVGFVVQGKEVFAIPLD